MGFARSCFVSFFFIFVFLLEENTATRHQVIAHANGTFSPQLVEIFEGDTVVWQFENRLNASILPVEMNSSSPKLWCTQYKAINEGGESRDFTGPWGTNASGVYVISPKELRNPWNQLLPSSWSNGDLTGVLLRIKWNDFHIGPNEFDWTVVDKEMYRAVQHGKFIFMTIMPGKDGIPSWVFKEGGVTNLNFKDFSDTSSDSKCFTMSLGGPNDMKYREHYFNALQQLSAHLKSKNAFYRRIAYVQVTGLTKLTPENKAPLHCEKENNAGTCKTFCNVQIWADSGYRPSNLYSFYSNLTKTIAEAFSYKEKQMVYALISKAFPDVHEDGTWTTRAKTIYTENLVEQMCEQHGTRAVIQNNALHPRASPNSIVLTAAQYGYLTGFQTTNNVKDTAILSATMENEYSNSDGVFLQVYEDVLKQPGASNLIADFSHHLHERAGYALFPNTFEHTFDMNVNGEFEDLYYISGPYCQDLPSNSSYAIVRVRSTSHPRPS